MASKQISIIGIIVGVVLTGLGLWGAYFYRDAGNLWVQNIYSDLFGAGVFAALLFAFVFIYDLLNGD